MIKDLINTKELKDEDRRRYYNAWGSSGLSKAAFCRAERIPLETFHYWHKRYRKGDEPFGEFSRVNIKQTSTEITYSTDIEIGMRLANQTQFQMRLSIQQLIVFVRGLSDATSTIR